MKLEWYDAVTDHAIIQLLPPIRPPKQRILVLFDDDTPVAAAYGSIDSTFEMVSANHPKFARSDAITPLFKALENEVNQHQLSTAALFYYDDDAQAPQIEKALAANGWSEPEEWMANFRFDHSFNPPWVFRSYPLPLPFSLAPWNSLTEQQIARLHHKAAQYVFPPNLSPFLHGSPDADYSVCLLSDDEVVGWMTTRMVAEDTISYDSFFIEPKYRKQRTILALLSQSVKNVLNSAIPYAVMEVNLNQTETSYINFIHKRYAPFNAKVNYTLRSWKLTNA